jgi:hypothetical protein
MLPNTPWKCDTIECVDYLTHKFESDIEFVLVVLTASTALISRLTVKHTKHFETARWSCIRRRTKGSISGCSEREGVVFRV